MIFLFDNIQNESILHDCLDWSRAELYARDNALQVVGEFICWVDEDTLEETYLT